MHYFLATLIIGIGATAVMDLWSLLRKPLLGLPPPDYALVGRWIAHMSHGRFCHDSIAKSPAMRHEHILGWVTHYLVGIGFSTLLIGVGGISWIQEPTLGLALIVGIGTVAAPFFLMQPSMGAGIAASRMPDPNRARIQSLITHTVFGLGLYATGVIVNVFFSI